MYSLVSAVVKTLDSNGQWVTADIGNSTMASLYSGYRRVIAILSNPFTIGNVAFDIDSVRKTQAGSTQTFNDFLTANGANQLTTSSQLPNLNVRYVRYGDAFKSKYTVTPINELTSPDAALPPGAKDWLYLTRPNTDYLKFRDTCLVSVNGFYHRMDASQQGIWVVDGMKTKRLANDNHIGITTFEDLGKLTVIPITDKMIFNQDSDNQLGLRAYINVGQSLDNCTFMVVIGGYLHVLDHKVVYRTGSNIICIDFENIPMLERFYESKDRIDLSSLGLDITDINPSIMSPEQFFSDAVIRKYLQLSQSFIVLLNNTEVFVERQALGKTTLPGCYISEIPPIWPIVGGFGKTVNFWSVEEDQKWSITAQDTVRPNFIFKTYKDAANSRNVSDSKKTDCRYWYDRLSHLKIGTNF